jgi:hypothetical protein
MSIAPMPAAVIARFNMPKPNLFIYVSHQNRQSLRKTRRAAPNT